MGVIFVDFIFEDTVVNKSVVIAVAIASLTAVGCAINETAAQGDGAEKVRQAKNSGKYFEEIRSSSSQFHGVQDLDCEVR